jgi:hypothetical protein
MAACIETERVIHWTEEFYFGKFYAGNERLFDCDAYLSKEAVEQIPDDVKKSNRCDANTGGVEIWSKGNVYSHKPHSLQQPKAFIFSLSLENAEKYLPKLVRFFKS